jgi:hypothetical protein
MKTVTLKSGNTLELQAGSFEDSWKLTQAVSAVLATSLPGFKIDSLDAAELQKDIDVGKIIGVVCQLVASPTVYELLWPCFLPCLYNGNKVTKVAFQDEAARKDFLPAVVELLRTNVVPFIVGLDLSFLTSQAPKAPNQKR